LRFDQLVLTEAKARIDHPEDLIFNLGAPGATLALNILRDSVTHPNHISIKFDGSPALIIGRDDLGFTVTDKAGFNNRKPEGLPRNQDQLLTMLYTRAPDQPGRGQFAQSIAELWRYFEKMLPSNFQGFVQCDLMWTRTPQLIDGKYVFKPNKVVYKVDAQSQLGQAIGASRIGIVLHSYFSDRYQSEPQALSHMDNIKINPVHGLLVLNPKLDLSTVLKWPEDLGKQISSLITKEYDAIDDFLNPANLRSAKISNLPQLMKKYVNVVVRSGSNNWDSLDTGFKSWFGSNSSVTPSKTANIVLYIAEHQDAYQAVWAVVKSIIHIKMNIKHQLDNAIDGIIHAEIKGQAGHEGYVSDSSMGKIKLVDRPYFMQDDFNV